MSLHNKILAVRGDTEENSDSYALGLCDAKQEAAALAIKADAEIARLQSQFDPGKFAHRPECFGSQIDTHCIGCTMAYREMYEDEIARLNRENSVLRDLLRGVMATIEVVEVDDGIRSEPVIALLDRVNAALNGQDGGLFDGGKK